MKSNSPTTDARTRRKQETRSRLRQAAMTMFRERGYDATTVGQIAAAAGVSHMTFFRYFGSKEEVVFASEHKSAVVDHLLARPADEPPAEKICNALIAGLSALGHEERRDLLERTRLVFATPALHARYLQQHPDDQRMIVKALEGESTSAGAPGMTLWVLTSACLAAVATAVRFWVEADGSTNLAELVKQAFADLRDGFAGIDHDG